jgi:integrase
VELPPSPGFIVHGATKAVGLDPKSVSVPPTDDPLARWLLSKSNKGCLPKTIRRYRWAGERTIRALREANRASRPDRWTTEDGVWLRRRFHDEPWQLWVVADLARFHGSRAFGEIGLPHRGPPRHVRWMTEATARAVFDVTRADPKLRMIALLGLGQGLRRIEWIRLQVTDFDLEGNRLLVRGKGRARAKLAWTTLHPAVPDALRDYLRIRVQTVRRFLRQAPDASVPEELFVHVSHGRLRPYSIGGMDRWVFQIERKLAERGVHVKLSSHMFRRSAATFLERTLLRSPEASRDGVYRTLQGFLRHENLATTMKYLEADPTRQQRAMEAFAQALPWDGATDASVPIRESLTSVDRPGPARRPPPPR